MDKSVKRATPKNTAVRDHPVSAASFPPHFITMHRGDRQSRSISQSMQTPEKHLVKVTKEIQDRATSVNL